MTLIELFLIAVGLSMDAFAVAICKGLSMRKVRLRASVTVGLYFGIFQGLMPLIGFLLGRGFAEYIVTFDHWVAFVLLAIIGGKMIHGAWQQKDVEDVIDESRDSPDSSLAFSVMFPAAIATSIDALAIGVGFAFLQVSIVPAVSFIGAVTFTLSAIGVYLGSVFGSRFKVRAEIAGGIILVLIGVKILVEHLFFM